MAQLITPEATISYPKLFRAEAMEEGDEKKFSAAFIFDADADLSELKAAVIAAGKAKWGDQFEGMLANGQLRSPFRSGSEKSGYPDDSTFFNARSGRKPGVVSTIPDAEGRPTVITDENDVVAGAKVKAAVAVFTYDRMGNKGISFGLNAVQLLRPPTEEETGGGDDALEDLL
jgi:hypothetical protein